MRGAQEFLVHPYLLWDGSIRMRFYNTVLINMGQPSTPTVQVQATVVLGIYMCSRALPLCQHRSVRFPLGTPKSAINHTLPATAAVVEVSYSTYYY